MLHGFVLRTGGMMLPRKGTLTAIEFWTAVATGWFTFSLVWKSNFQIDRGLQIKNEDCLSCVDKVCQKCPTGELTPAISLGENVFYRDFPWKPLNVVEARATNWKMISKKYRDGMQNEDPRVGINGMWRLEQEQVESRVKSLMSEGQSEDLMFRGMMRKLDPFYGVSYIAHMKSRESNSLEVFELRRRFQPDKPMLMDINHLDKTEIVHIITPLSKVSQRFHLFLERLEKNIYSSNKPSHEKLIFIIFGESRDKDTVETIEALEAFQKRNPNAVMEHNVVKGDFSRAIGLDTGIKMCPPGALMLFLDVDLSITLEFLDRVRGDTIQNEQVVFPIMFSQFDPGVVDTYAKSQWAKGKKLSDADIGMDKGFWIHYAFGVAAMYKADYFAVGGFALDIVGWGGEDVNLFKKFIASPTIEVMSTVDPDLIHIYHSRACDSSLSTDQYRMCIGSLSETIGSQTQLSNLYLQKKTAQYFVE